MNIFKIWQVLIFVGKNIFPSSMNLWLMESKNGIDNEKKMSVAALPFLDFQVYFGGAATTNENTETSVPLK